MVKKIRTNVEHFEAGNCKDKKKKRKKKRTIFLQNMLQKNDLNAIKVIKNIKKVKVKKQSQKHYKLSMYYARVMMKLIQYFCA